MDHNSTDACHLDQFSCIRRVPIFDRLTEDEVEALHDVTQRHNFVKRQYIFREGEPSDSLYVVSRGVVKISKVSDAGKEHIFRILFPGDFFGQFALLMHQNHYSNAEVIEDAAVCVIHGADLKRVIERNPATAYRFLEAVAEKLHVADEWTGAISLLDVERRVAKILLLFHEKSQAAEQAFQLPVPKKDFAALIGTTAETLSRKLAYFESLSLLQLEGPKKIRILDEEALNEIAGVF